MKIDVLYEINVNKSFRPGRNLINVCNLYLRFRTKKTRVYKQYETRLNRYFICTAKPKQIFLLNRISLDFVIEVYCINTFSIVSQSKMLFFFIATFFVEKSVISIIVFYTIRVHFYCT